MGMSGHASGEAVVAVTVAMTVLAAIAVISRLCTRIGIVHNAGIDDGFIAAALVHGTMQPIPLQVADHRSGVLDRHDGDHVLSGQVWHGQASDHTHPGRSDRDLKAILGVYLGLQPRHIVHEVLDTVPISTDISPDAFPVRLLLTHRRGFHLQLLDVLQRRVCLHASPVLLDSQH